MSRYFEEKLIDTVRGFGCLYDSTDKNYHDTLLKDKAWVEIATIMNSSASVCKRKWTSIRDNYRKAMRKRKRKGGQMKRKPYKYQEILSFLAPFITERDHQTTIPLEDSAEFDELHDQLEDDPMEEEMASGAVSTDSESCREVNSPIFQIENKSRPQTATVLPNYFQKHPDQRLENKDCLTKFFEAMEETVRTFSPLLQIEVKSKISSLVTDYELKNLMAQTAPPQSSGSAARRSGQPRTSAQRQHSIPNFENDPKRSFSANHSAASNSCSSSTQQPIYTKTEVDDTLLPADSET